MRLLEKQPADRPQSAEEVMRELEAIAASGTSGMRAASPERWRAKHRVAQWFGSTLLLTAIIGTSLYWRWARASERRNAATPVVAPARSVSKSVAVLPFVNLSAEPETEYFSDGMTEELIDALAKVPELPVQLE